MKCVICEKDERAQQIGIVIENKFICFGCLIQIKISFKTSFDDLMDMCKKC